jgi:hypothetical protein
MALIKCPECGREISDKAISCPGCGCPISSDPCEKLDYSFVGVKGISIQIKNGIMKISEKNGSVICNDYINNYTLLYTKPAAALTNGIIIISHRNLTKSIVLGIKQKEVEEFNQLTGILMKYCKIENCTFNEAVNYKPNKSLLEQRELKEYRKAQRTEALNMLSGNNKIAKCPKCHSTSIAYDTKKLSISRAVVGNAVAGAPGAVLGGLSSKKGYAVCLNCGKRWKV